MHHRKEYMAMNKQAILEMTINSPITLLCMTDFFFSVKNYVTDTGVIISNQVSLAQGTHSLDIVSMQYVLITLYFL